MKKKKKDENAGQELHLTEFQGQGENFRAAYLYVQKIPGKIFFRHKRREEAGLVIELGVERKKKDMDKKSQLREHICDVFE